MKKVLYAFLILFILLVVALVSVVNSSIVIDKIAQKFAPDYNLSYAHLSGNVFTGITIDKLKYNEQVIANDIIYRWDPVSLLQRKISINKIKVENADIDVIKSLIASFDVDESDDQSSEPFNFDVSVDNISISLNPFQEKDISFNKMVLTADDVIYFKSGAVDVNNLFLNIDSNLTKFSFKGSMHERKLTIDALTLKSLNSKMLENIITKLTDNNDSTNIKENQNDKENNPLIPELIDVKHFSGSVQAREFRGVQLDKLHLLIDDLKVNISKIVEHQKESLNIGNVEVAIQSDLLHIDMKAKFEKETVWVDHLILKEVNSTAIQKFVAKESNTTHSTETEHTAEKKEPNVLIPKTVVIKQLKTDVLPTKFEPVNIEKLLLNGKNIHFDVENLLVKDALLELNGTTNLSNISFHSGIKNNQMEGKISLFPNEPLFELYKLPLRREALGTIEIDLNASKEYLKADVKVKAKQILKSKEGEFNLDIEDLLSHIVYRIENNSLKINSRAIVSTPYAKNITLSNLFTMDHNITYKGDIRAKELQGIDANFTAPLRDLNIQYKGDSKSIQTLLTSKQLKGSFYSDDFKKGSLHLETLTPVMLKEMVKLPEELTETKVNAMIDMPVDFNRTFPLKAKVKIDSNVANIDADILYNKAVKVIAKMVIPKNSLLEDMNDKVKWKSLSPLNIEADAGDENATLKLTSKYFHANTFYQPKSTYMQGKATLGGLVLNANGTAKKNLKIDTKITSMKVLKESIASLYTLEELPPVEGVAEISATISELKRVNITLRSPKITYQADRKSKQVITDIQLNASLDQSKVLLNSYALTYNKQKLFSTKPSIIQMEGSKIKINPLWLNDTLNITGEYDLKTAQGKIDTKAKKFPIRHEYADIDTMIDIETLIDGNSTSVNGKVTLLGGKIKYDISQKSFASDSDIIIVQEMKKKKASPFMDNLSANIQIRTEKPLVLKQGAINIKLKPDLGINKVQHGPLLVLGSVELPKGGSYIFEGKKFILDKSFVHFTGNPNKPLLEIKVKYKSVKHLITISISGTPDAPNINFSSSPSLTKEQILSVILFDSEAGGDTHSGDEMMKMMGGAMAKSALADMGIKLDHLVLGEGNSVEVGKKLTNKITIIYVNDIVSSVKLKYEHSPRTESVIEVSEESQSYDIIYKRDF